MNLPNTQSLARSMLILGDACVDVGRLTVVGRGQAGKLAPKSMSVLIELARHAEQTVTRAELLERVWPDTHPSQDLLSHAVAELRRALGDDARSPRFIETVHRLGYRLLVSVRVEETEILDPLAEEGDRRNSAKDPDVSELTSTPAPLPTALAKPISGVHFRAYIGIVALLCASLAAGHYLSRNSSGGDALSWEPLLVTSDVGAEEFPKLSPDATTLVFSRRDSIGGRWDLNGVNIADRKTFEITRTGTEDELLPAWSPDGDRLAFVHIAGARCSIEVMRLTGDDRRGIAECDRIIFSGLDWSPDGRYVLTSLPSDHRGRELRLTRIPVSGGALEPLGYHVDRPGWDRDPAYSPDGRLIAFRRGLPPDYDVFVVASSGGQAKRLTRLGSVGEGLTWMPDGREIVFWSQHEGRPELYRVDIATGELKTTDLRDATRPHIARNGARLAFQRPWLRVGLVAANVNDPLSEPIPLSESNGSVGVVANSSDLRRLAYVSDRSGFEQVWIHEPGQKDRAYGDQTLSHITSVDWSDDGNKILLVARRGDLDQALTLDLGTGKLSDTGLSRPLLRDAVGSEDEGRIFSIVQGKSRLLLARFERDGDQWRETVSEIPATELIRVPGVKGVFGRTPLRPDVILRVAEDLSIREIPLRPRVYGWTAGRDAVWYISSEVRAKSELRRLDLVTGEDRYVRALPHHLPRRRAGMALLGNQMVIAIMVEDRADVGIVELPL